MQNKSDDSEIVAELIEVTHELNDLIEDNNQNIKDCYKILKRIEEKVCPPKPSLIRRLISKLINTSVVL